MSLSVSPEMLHAQHFQAPQWLLRLFHRKRELPHFGQGSRYSWLNGLSDSL
jgi:hypothetical protein